MEYEGSVKAMGVLIGGGAAASFAVAAGGWYVSRAIYAKLLLWEPTPQTKSITRHDSCSS